VTFTVVAGLFIGVGVALYLIRDLVLVREFGTHWSLWVAAAGAYVISMGIEIQCRKHLKFKTLAGVPELEADQSGRRLLDQGIYGRVRHPRYVGVTFGILAMALFANYLALWILWPVTIVSLYVIALLEERELIASLGQVYEEYRERVPMFVPKGRQ
jgi:protein-S-isoprenylcysteine O-methyltransferase Ste14